MTPERLTAAPARSEMTPDEAAGAGTARPLRGAVAFSLWSLVVAAVIAVALIAWQRSGLPGLEGPDRFFYDLRHVYLAKSPPTTLPSLAIVSVTPETLYEYAAEQPTDREMLAQLVSGLSDSGVRAIGLDLRFDRPTDPAKDRALAEAIRDAKVPVVVGVVDDRSALADKAKAFQRQFLAMAGDPRVGHLYFDRKRHGIGQPDLAVRFIARRTNDPGHVEKSFAEELLEAAGIVPVDIGQTRIAAEDQIGPHIAWLGPTAQDGSRTFAEIDVLPTRPASATFEQMIPRELRPLLAGRMVIIGGRFEDLDRHVTPFSVLDGARMAGAQIHAQIVAQLADGRKLISLAMFEELALLAAIGLVGFAFGYQRRQSGGLGDYLLLSVLLILAGGLAFRLYNVILPSDTMFYAALASIAVGHQGLRWKNAIRRGRIPRI